MNASETMLWTLVGLTVVSWIWAAVTVSLAGRRHDRHTSNLLEENRRLTELVAAVKTPWAAEVVRSLQAGQELEGGGATGREPEPPEVLA